VAITLTKDINYAMNKSYEEVKDKFNKVLDKLLEEEYCEVVLVKTQNSITITFSEKTRIKL
jgi:archaellum component FlaF (FlaF/FlaG flagellin family)